MAHANRFFRSLDREAMCFLPAFLFGRWEAGDATVAVLVDEAISSYAVQLKAMLRRLPEGCRPTAVLGGGVLSVAPERFWSRIAAELPGVPVHKPLHAPGIGAALMAAKANGACVQKLYRSLDDKECTCEV